jgi:hypothetical protein
MKKWKHDWKSPEYNAWMHMLHRCNNPKDKAFKYYGAKGVKVCDRWVQSFDDFCVDMGPRPSLDHSLDRINVFGDYEPSNCKWSNRIEQANNKRVHKRVDFFGEMLTAREIADRTGVAAKTVKSRIDQRMSAEKIASKSTHIRKNWEHGTIYGYIKMKCRCEPCRQAKSVHAKACWAKKVSQII